jgi:hypothetical protein
MRAAVAQKLKPTWLLRERGYGHRATDTRQVLHGEVSLDGETIWLHHVAPDTAC